MIWLLPYGLGVLGVGENFRAEKVAEDVGLHWAVIVALLWPLAVAVCILWWDARAVGAVWQRLRGTT